MTGYGTLSQSQYLSDLTYAEGLGLQHPQDTQAAFIRDGFKGLDHFLHCNPPFLYLHIQRNTGKYILDVKSRSGGPLNANHGLQWLPW